MCDALRSASHMLYGAGCQACDIRIRAAWPFEPRHSPWIEDLEGLQNFPLLFQEWQIHQFHRQIEHLYVPFNRYNCSMHVKVKIPLWVGLLVPLALLAQLVNARAAGINPAPAQSGEVTAFDLIIAMNTLRASYGLPALVEDPIIDSVAQSTAEIMAANNMSSHIGNVSGRLQSAGYGGGSGVGNREFRRGTFLGHRPDHARLGRCRAHDPGGQPGLLQHRSRRGQGSQRADILYLAGGLHFCKILWGI